MPQCDKVCAPGSTLDIKSCTCLQRTMGPQGSVFDSQTGRFNTPKGYGSMGQTSAQPVQPVQPAQSAKAPITKPAQPAKPTITKPTETIDNYGNVWQKFGGSVIKGSSLRRQASTKGLRTSKKYK
jgi:hypothetical protein